MDESASFWTQANALLRKDLTFQKRNIKTNIGLIVFPIFLCVLLLALQTLINKEFDKPQRNCGCKCITEDRDGNCLDKRCGVQYSDVDQAGTCSIPSPPEWPAFLQLPYPEFATARSSNSSSFSDLPDESCRRTKSCPATVLFTGSNRSLAQRVAESLFISDSPNGANRLDSLPFFILGTDAEVTLTNFIEPAIFSPSMYIVRSQCLPNDSISFGFTVGAFSFPNETKCIQGLPLWRDSSSVINDELYKGYGKGNAENKINGIVAAYDFLNTSEQAFNAFVSYNSTYKKATQGPPTLIRITRSVNMVTNAFLSSLKGSGTKILLQFVKEMPKPATKLRLDFASLLGPLFFTWIVLLLFPVILQSLVYEKQKKLRIMMKMHGLGDGPYWLISYAYFFALSALYISCFVIFGSVIGLKFFTLNSYGIQFVFYFIYMNLQISLAFLLAIVFSNEMVAKVVGYICVFKAGLIGSFLFQFFVEDTSFPRSWIIVMEIIPLFSLFRGLYEFSQYSFSGNYMGTSGMRWSNLNDTNNGMKEILIIMAIEWLVMLPIAYYLDQVASVGSGVRKHPLFFLRHFRKYSAPSFRKPSLQRGGSKVFVEMDKPDVVEEREVVEKLMVEPSASYAIVCHNLRKTYPGRDGNPDKLAVKGISLALPRGECFGMLGPNGAGKTSFINMMIGLNVPTSGTAFVEGLNIRTDMDRIYNLMGVCPQYDLLWETLTGREHLLFYGRLKNLKGAALMDAVEESLKSVNLFHGGVGDKYAGKYSGGMKRRLSVAISLIGNPKVVYMDEPSTGLDPASRNNLWNVIQNAKRDRAIILTTHSMDEAEYLCDRLGIFVDGELQCIGNPKQLKSRYGGSYIFTMTTSSDREQDVRNLVHRLSPNAVRVYHISGTQKFEMPKQEVQISNVFREVEIAKSKFTIYAWGLVDTTLEDVFIKVAKGDSKG